jgi:DNA-binding transcriptional LysR family regulator
MAITLRQLDIFAATAASGNLTRAAGRIGLSQSAASMALAELERQFSEPLFDRVGKRLVLNERGRALLPRAQEVLARVREIGDLFGSEAGRLAGELRIGASSTIGNYLIPHLLGQLAGGHPELKLHLDVVNTEQVIAGMAAFAYDIGFVEGPCRRPELETIPWRDDTLAVFAAAGHPLAAKAVLTPVDLAAARWILREPGSGTREVFETAVAGRLAPLHVFLELGHSEAIKQAVEAGLGIGCLSLLTLERALAVGVLKLLPTPFLDFSRTLNILIHRDKYRTAVLRAFLDYCLAPGGADG